MVLWTLALAACSDESQAGVSSSPTLGERQIEREIRDLITAVTPLDPRMPAGTQADWIQRRRDVLERLRGAGEEVGLAALESYEEKKDERPEVRIGLLDVAAHCAPQAARETLVELVTTYGDDLGLRSRACRFLGETSPERAVEVLTPILFDPDVRGTYPVPDQMLESWISAMNRLGRDKCEGLVAVVTDVRQPHEVRHRAARELGTFRCPRGQRALESVVVESSGNHYLRRKAIQALRDTVDKEEFCAYVTEVLLNEADLGFQLFLDRTLDDVCK